MNKLPSTIFKKGSIPWNKGKKNVYTEKTKNMMAKARLGKIGKLSNNWKGGITRNKHAQSRPEYKKWREAVFKRDDYRCQNCGERGIYLEAHHIKSWAKFAELRYVVDNGITYCRDCHIELDAMRGRFFNKKL